MMGTILRVNLTTGVLSCQSAEPYQQWVGGIGVAQKILYDEVKPWVSAYDPANRFIVATGALSGTLCPGTGRIAAVSKSPMTTGIASANSGGAFGPHMRFAGFEYIVIEGRSIKPVYLFIKDGRAELRDASEICGLPVRESVDWFEKIHGKQISTMCIGPAGERLVRYACVTIDRNRVMGKCGFGAVMGSKNLKGIVADGSTGSFTPADPMGLMKKIEEVYERVKATKNYHPLMKYGTLCHVFGKIETGGFNYKHNEDLDIPEEMVKEYNPDHICGEYRTHQSSCGGCFIGCQNHHRVRSGPAAGLTMGGTPYNSILNFGTKLGIADYGFCIEATWMCNNLGMDMDVVAEILGWVMECYEKKLIGPEHLDGLELSFGAKRDAIELIRKMAYREGIGDLLAEGTARASTVLPREASYYAVHVKGNDLYEILRSLIGYGLGAVTCTRGGSHVLGSPVCESGKFDEEEQKIAKAKFGVDTFNQPTAYEGKPEIVAYYEALTRACSCMGLCIFVSDWQQICMLDLKDLAELLRLSSGIELSAKELEHRMMALLNLEKMFNYCHAGFTRRDDQPRERLFREAVKSGPAAGAILEHDKWDAMLDHYYKIHGWDPQTGIPTAETLRFYGLEELVEDLQYPAQAPGHAFVRNEMMPE